MGACCQTAHCKIVLVVELCLDERIYELDTHSQWRNPSSQPPQFTISLHYDSRQRDMIVISRHSRAYSSGPSTHRLLLPLSIQHLS